MEAMKFVMFPSGVVFFTALANHYDCSITSPEGKEGQPVAAGSIYSTKGGACALGGKSHTLGMNATTAYPDWLERQKASGLPIERIDFPGWSKTSAFLFPFEAGQKFEVRGLGQSTEPRPATYEEFLEHAQQSSHF